MGPSFPTGASEPIGVNDTKTVTGIAAGDYQVSLSGVPSNCAVSGANPRTVTVTAGNTASTTFSVSCTGTTTGTLSVTTATTGQNIPASYTLNVTGPSFPTGASTPINANGNVTATRHLRRLPGVAERCTEQLRGERSEPPHGHSAHRGDGPDHVLG